MRNKMGVEAGVNLARLIASATSAEDVVGHPLPSSVMPGGTLAALREAVRLGATV